MCNLQLISGGKLIETIWNKITGEYETIEVTSKAQEYLWRYCTFEEELLLQDVFLLLNRNLDFYNKVIGNWCKEIVSEGLTNPSKSDYIDYLNLYWTLSVEDAEFVGNDFPRFNGIGSYDNEDVTEGRWAVNFSPANELALNEIRLNKEIVICTEDWLYEDSPQYITIQNPNYTLGSILYGIIWELSFNGSPANREKKRNELQKTINKSTKRR